jgi:RNAse (barnase) inhibitor barstar
VAKPVYVIDGTAFSTLQEFYEVISTVLIPGADWGWNLNAFNDILRGGFGTPEGGFVLVWKNSAMSRQRLGYFEDLTRGKRKIGPTVF